MSWLLSWGDCQHDWSPLTASGKGFCLYFRQTVLLHYIWSLQLLPLSASALNIVPMFLALTLVSLPSLMLPLQVSYTGSRSDKSVQKHQCCAGLGSEAAECAWDLALHSQLCWGCCALELNRSSDPVQLLWKLPINIQGLCWQACIRFIPPGQSSHLFSHRECPRVPRRFSGG